MIGRPSKAVTGWGPLFRASVAAMAREMACLRQGVWSATAPSMNIQSSSRISTNGAVQRSKNNVLRPHA